MRKGRKVPGMAEDEDNGDTEEKDISDTTAPSIGPDTTIEREAPETRLARHEQSDVDAMGLDKRRQVIGGSYGPSFARQATLYGGVLAIVAAIMIGFILLAGKLDQPPETNEPRRPGRRPTRRRRRPHRCSSARSPAVSIAACQPSGSPGSASTSSTGIRHRSDASRAIRAPSAGAGHRAPRRLEDEPPHGRVHQLLEQGLQPGAVDRRELLVVPEASPAASRRSPRPRSGRRPCRRSAGRRAPSIPASRISAKFASSRVVPRTCHPAGQRGAKPPPRQPQPTIRALATRRLVLGEIDLLGGGQLRMCPGTDLLVLGDHPIEVVVGHLDAPATPAPLVLRVHHLLHVVHLQLRLVSYERVGFQSTRSAPLPG